MPDLTGLTALDVAIGLFFLYFLLSIVCSTISEMIAGALGWRAANLELAIRHLIQAERVTAFWSNPRIRALGEPVAPRKGILPRRSASLKMAWRYAMRAGVDLVPPGGGSRLRAGRLQRDGRLAFVDPLPPFGLR
jgi:hypothetical protein